MSAKEKLLELEIKRLLAEQGGSEVDIARSIADGVNATAKDVQKALQDMLSKRLKFESATVKKFMLQRMSKISKFAKNNDPHAVVSTVPIKGTVIVEMETGGSETPDVGKSQLMTPTKAAVGGKTGKVASRYRFATMGLKRDGDALKGNGGVFAIKGVGVFQRTKRGVKMIYAASPHRTIRKLIMWKIVARMTVERRLMANIRSAHIGRMARRAGKK
jgi:hypothetical protein